MSVYESKVNTIVKTTHVILFGEEEISLLNDNDGCSICVHYHILNAYHVQLHHCYITTLVEHEKLRTERYSSFGPH